VKLNQRNRRSHQIGIRAAKAFSLACLLAVSCAGAARAADDTLFHKTLPLTAGGNFLLENVNGSVSVEGWDREEVEVSAVKVAKNETSDLSQVQIDVESEPGKVAVRTLYPKGEGAEVAVEYRVHVPFHVLLGSVNTVNGSVIVKGVDGGGELKTVNGNVEVFDSAGRFSEKTTNGNLRLELRRLVEGGPMKLETVNGSVILGLPQDVKANVSALSMNGELYSEFPSAAKSHAQAAHSFNGKLGAGGGNISVRTVNGGIRLVVQHPVV
jgi:Putative adhesin